MLPALQVWSRLSLWILKEVLLSSFYKCRNWDSKRLNSCPRWLSSGLTRIWTWYYVTPKSMCFTLIKLSNLILMIFLWQGKSLSVSSHFIDENIGYKKFHLEFPPGEGLGPNLTSWDPVATIMWWPGTGLYLGDKEWTLPSLGRPPAIFGPRLPQFEAELLWSTGEALVGPTFQPWKEIIHLIYRDVQKYTDWILEILTAMHRACRFLKFGEGQLRWSWNWLWLMVNLTPFKEAAFIPAAPYILSLVPG